jgi:DnaJ-class molecular chaperone
MICPACQGKGFILPAFARKKDGAPVGTASTPCPECNGSGVVHCCEGDQAQPEQPEKAAQ